jgi:hypothetical protein
MYRTLTGRFSCALAALALGALVLICGPTFTVNRGAQAQSASPSPEALQAARELTSVISTVTIAEFNRSVSNQAWPGVEKVLRSRNPGISAAALGDFRRELEGQQLSVVLDSLNDLAAIYARHFTVEEMRAVTAFYRTPAGAKTLVMMPRINSEVRMAIASRMQALQAKAAEATTRFLNANVGVPPRAPQQGAK